MRKFLYMLCWGANIIPSVNIQLSQHHSLKRLLFCHCIMLHPCWKSLTINIRICLGLSILSMNLDVCSHPNTTHIYLQVLKWASINPFTCFYLLDSSIHVMHICNIMYSVLESLEAVPTYIIWSILSLEFILEKINTYVTLYPHIYFFMWFNKSAVKEWMIQFETSMCESLLSI